MTLNLAVDPTGTKLRYFTYLCGTGRAPTSVFNIPIDSAGNFKYATTDGSWKIAGHFTSPTTAHISINSIACGGSKGSTNLKLKTTSAPSTPAAASQPQKGAVLIGDVKSVFTLHIVLGVDPTGTKLSLLHLSLRHRGALRRPSVGSRSTRRELQVREDGRELEDRRALHVAHNRAHLDQLDRLRRLEGIDEPQAQDVGPPKCSHPGALGPPSRSRSTPSPASTLPTTGKPSGSSTRREQLVVLAEAEVVDRRARRERHAVELDHAADARAAGEVPGVDRDAVGEVEHRVRGAREPLALGEPERRADVAARRGTRRRRRRAGR